MTAFAWNENHAGHFVADHPERPERLDSVIAHLQKSGLWQKLEVLNPRLADRSDAELIHAPAYLDRLETATAYGARLDPDTYTTDRSLATAYASLGAVLSVAGAVLEGSARNGFAATRPPGHHATPHQAMGFCLLSNVAIAVRGAQRRHGLERVAVVDFDVHHGNGTQDAFYEDGSVLFMSTHQWPLYPGTGSLEERGSGQGAGTTINVPLPEGAGDAALERAFRQVFEPAIAAFKPELIVVSAGYDAHWMDPLAGMRATASGFGRLTEILLEWADTWSGGKMLMVMEGGYNLKALTTSVQATLSKLLQLEEAVDDPLGDPPGGAIEAVEAIDRARAVHKR